MRVIREVVWWRKRVAQCARGDNCATLDGWRIVENSANDVVVAPAGPMCMIARVVTTLRDARVRHARGHGRFHPQENHIASMNSSDDDGSETPKTHPASIGLPRSAGTMTRIPRHAAMQTAMCTTSRPADPGPEGRLITERRDDRSRLKLRSGEKTGRRARRTVFTAGFAATTSRPPVRAYTK